MVLFPILLSKFHTPEGHMSRVQLAVASKELEAVGILLVAVVMSRMVLEVGIMYREMTIICKDSLSRSKPDVEPLSPVEEVIHLLDVGIARVLTLILYAGVAARKDTMRLIVVHLYLLQVLMMDSQVPMI